MEDRKGRRAKRYFALLTWRSLRLPTKAKYRNYRNTLHSVLATRILVESLLYATIVDLIVYM